jgi:RIO kinase 1
VKRDANYLDDLLDDLDDDESIDLPRIKGLDRLRRMTTGGKRPTPRGGEAAAATTSVELEFETTYTPARYEKEWLRSSLRPFYDQRLIVDVLAQVKGGKEANVYRCAAHPETGLSWVAAKVYRPRQFRNLSNDALYREGRSTLTADGTAAKKTDTRLMRALNKKTDFGVQVAHTSWLMHEFTAMERLHLAGAAVPRPLATGENALAMSYYGDGNLAAPTLNGVTLAPDEAERLFADALRNIELFLRLGLIHGDLSAYNILYWEGTITIIDFPQVVSMAGNRNARPILARDVTRVCQYFAGQGVACDAASIIADLCARYGVREAGALPEDELPLVDEGDDSD